jgi:hypothetical protein
MAVTPGDGLGISRNPADELEEGMELNWKAVFDRRRYHRSATARD